MTDETRSNENMFSRLKIGTKILIVTALISMTIITAVGIISDLSTRDAFEAEAFNKLTAVREMKGQQIEEYFETIAQQIRSLSQSQDVIEGMGNLKTGIKSLSSGVFPSESRKLKLQNFYKTSFSQEYQKHSGGVVADINIDALMKIDEMAEFLQSEYLVENIHPIGQKNKLLHEADGIYYNGMHRRHHPFFNQYLDKFGFYDIFLIDPEDGRIIYSVFKEVDFGTSLLTGPYKDSNLARAFNAARVSTDPEFVSIVDFEPYTPSYGAPAAFMASPIIHNGKITGVLAFQMPVDQINDIMTSQQAWQSVGLGLSGETYLVGADKLLRNQSRFLIEDRENYLEIIRDTGTPEETVQKIGSFDNSIGLQKVDTEGTRAALAGESDTRIFPDYRGVSVLSSYRPLKLHGLDWVIMSEIDETEAFLPFDKLRDRMIMLASALLALTIYISYFFSLSLTRPLRFLESSAHALADGRLDDPITRNSNDEIGDLASSFEAMRVALKQTFGEVEQQKNELEDRVRDRTAELDAILENIDYGILLMDDNLKSRMTNRAFRDMWMVPDEFADANPTMKELMYSHLPKGFYDFVPRRDFDTYVNERTHAAQAGAVPLAVMDRSDGKSIQVQCVVLPGGGRMITYFDITAMKRKEEELAEKEAQLRLAFDNMPAGIKFIDKDKKIIAFNQQYLEVMGYPDDLIQEGGSSLEELKYQAERGDLGSGNPDELVKKVLTKHGGDETVFIERELFDGRVAAITIQNTPDGQRVTVVNDITERKKAEQAMHEVYQIFDQMPMNVFVRDAEGRFKYINHAYENFHKVKNQDIVGKALSEIFPQQVGGSYSQKDDEVIKEGKQLTTEENIETDKGTVTFSVIKFPISDLEGNRIAVAGIDLDITERKKAEQAMGEVYQIVDQVPMNVFIRDIEGRYKYINRHYEEYINVKSENVIGKTVREIFSEDSDTYNATDDEVINNRKLVSSEEQFEFETGTLTAASHKFPILDDDGNVVAVSGIDIDITEQKRAEEAIKRRAMEASLLHRATQLAAETDIFDKSLQQCVDLVCELTGWPIGHVYLPAENGAPELVSASIWHDQDPEKHAEFKTVTESYTFKMGQGMPGRIWESGEPVWISDVTLDSNFPRKDICNHLSIRSAFGFPIEIRDEVVAVLEFFSDETVPTDARLLETMATVGIQVGQVLERKRSADELSDAKDAADEANQAKSAFLANMSHELRTPMNAILGYAEMLAEDAEDEGDDDRLADIKEIMDSGEHLLSLLNDVLDISKVEAGRMDLYLETFDLAKMMGEVASTTKALVDKNSNTMEVSIADDMGEMHADVTKVRQILFNLMSNAAKFTSNGKITLFGERRSGENGDIIRLGVSDDGIGIPEDKLDHIFEEFSQADDTTTKNFGGTGLGLALVRRFCQMMGGDIWVESTVGEGSSFILELPSVVIDVEEKGASETLQDIPESTTGNIDISAGGGTILVIDDDPKARDLIKRSLESEGHDVTVAEGGDEGIALAHRVKPSLITLDIMMPGRDGWSVLQEIKDDPDLCDIPVVMVSMIDDKKMGSALGAVDHLSKPVDRNKLKALVKRYSKKGRALVVEDDDAAREVVSRALASIGWTSVEAENGAVGIEKFDDGKYDLIILDIMMPVMDGFGFIRELRKTENGRSVPVVVLTAKDLTAAERKELNGNVEEIFLKEETSVDELVKEISNQLAG